MVLPLRDHFRPPIDRYRSWEEFHGQLPGELVRYLMANLPPEYTAGATVHTGARIEFDIGAYKLDESEWRDSPSEGRVATLPFVPVKPSLAVEYDDTDDYEVRVYDDRRGRFLVAAIEIVSPANKDCVSHRKAFIAKCQAMLQQDISVMIVDIVTTRRSNLFDDLRRAMGLSFPKREVRGPYAVACRSFPGLYRRRLEAWEEPLAVGDPLPTLPLWLSETLALPLDLEVAYAEACRVMRIA